MGVGAGFEILASLQFVHQKLELAVGFPRRINQLLLEAISNSTETRFNLIRSLLSGL